LSFVALRLHQEDEKVKIIHVNPMEDILWIFSVASFVAQNIYVNMLYILLEDILNYKI